MEKLSIIIPVYNEAGTIRKVIENIESVDLPFDKELILIDDGSNDGTSEIIHSYKDKYKLISLSNNKGKGYALRKGFHQATGDIIIIQDADLEYNPKEYKFLIEPILAGDADVVYGSRFVTPFPRRVLYFSHYAANKFLTLLSNIFTGLNLSDMETGYKVFSKKALREILPHLKANRFGIEPEITAQIARHKLRVYEVGISYRGRTYGEGKKINWKDGLATIWHIVRFNIFKK